jgi:hypothetical protein
MEQLRLDSSVSIVTGYELDGQRFEYGEARFSKHIQNDRGANPASYTSTLSFPGVNRAGRGVNHPPDLVPRLMKKYSYTSNPTLLIRAMF